MIVKEWAQKRPCGDVNKYREGGCRCDLCRQAVAIAQREWRKNNPQVYQAMQRRDRLRRNYGLTPDQFNAMLVAQDNVCALCRRSPGADGILMVDHCHKTQQVRGLLCKSCNTKLGWFEKRPSEILSYLHKDES